MVAAALAQCVQGVARGARHPRRGVGVLAFECAVKVAAKKRTADELDKEQDVALTDLIDIGVVDDKGEPIAIERRRITQEETSFTLDVDRRPVKADIDPLNKLIDRRLDDNTIAVVFEGG